MSKFTEDVKEILSKATPGPWELEKSYNGYRVVNSETNELICKQKPHDSTINNLTLIANAPELLRILVEKVEVYQGQMINASNKWREELENAMFAEQQISKALAEFEIPKEPKDPLQTLENVYRYLQEWKEEYDKKQDLKWKRINDIITGNPMRKSTNLTDVHGHLIHLGDTVVIDGEKHTVEINDFTKEIVVDNEHGQEKLSKVAHLCEVKVIENE